MNKTISKLILRTIKAEITPKPVREFRQIQSYSRNPAKAITPVAIAGHFMPRSVRAIFDIIATMAK